MSVEFNVEADMLELEETIKQYQDGAEEKINTYLHGEGYNMFEKAIINGMPESGRKWSRKKRPAKQARSLQDKNANENLAVTIRATTAYSYLYFPNDGSNTEHHYGDQQFFEKGVEEKTGEAINDMIDALKL